MIGMRRAAFAALYIAVTSCGVTTPDVNENGTVEFVDIEGGCWVIEAGGTTYEPINLPAGMREDGLAVEFVAVTRDDRASTCQVGPIIELIRIEAAD
jgi:hypothetical protein